MCVCACACVRAHVCVCACVCGFLRSCPGCPPASRAGGRPQSVTARWKPHWVGSAVRRPTPLNPLRAHLVAPSLTFSGGTDLRVSPKAALSASVRPIVCAECSMSDGRAYTHRSHFGSNVHYPSLTRGALIHVSEACIGPVLSVCVCFWLKLGSSLGSSCLRSSRLVRVCVRVLWPNGRQVRT